MAPNSGQGNDGKAALLVAEQLHPQRPDAYSAASERALLCKSGGGIQRWAEGRGGHTATVRREVPERHSRQGRGRGEHRDRVRRARRQPLRRRTRQAYARHLHMYSYVTLQYCKVLVTSTVLSGG